jgi:hypothetical protein
MASAARGGGGAAVPALSRDDAVATLCALLASGGGGAAREQQRKEEEQEQQGEPHVDLRELCARLARGEPAVLRLLFAQQWLRPLSLARLDDELVAGMLEHGRALMSAGEFVALYSEHRPAANKPVSSADRPLLRDIFNAAKLYEVQAGLEPEYVKDLNVRGRAIMGAYEQLVAVRALVSSVKWLEPLFAGGSLRTALAAAPEVVSFEIFVQAVEVCIASELHLRSRRCTMDPLVVYAALSRSPPRNGWALAPFRSVTHVQVAALARSWGIDPAREPFLLHTVRQALLATLPAEFELLEPAEGGAPRFRNRLTGALSSEHPGKRYFIGLVEHERLQTEQLLELGGIEPGYEPSKAWMRFDFRCSTEQAAGAGRRGPAAAAGAGAGTGAGAGAGAGGGAAKAPPLEERDESKDAAADEGGKFQPQPLPRASETSTTISYFYNFASGRAIGKEPFPDDGFELRDQAGLLHSHVALTYPLRKSTEPGGAFAGASERSRALRRASPAKIANELELLHFRSWWWSQDEQLRRYIDIYHHLATGSFQVVVDGTERVFTLSHLPALRSGRPLQGWDLHVGAKIDVLGRPTTLRQASLLTAQWLEAHRSRLRAVWQRLRAELTKYEARAARLTGAALERPGAANLRVCLEDIKDLYDRLHAFRPKLADDIVGDTLDVLASPVAHT